MADYLLADHEIGDTHPPRTFLKVPAEVTVRRPTELGRVQYWEAINDAPAAAFVAG